MSILYSKEENHCVFPKKLLISAERRRKNIGELYKPTVPVRFVKQGPIIIIIIIIIMNILGA